MEEDFELDSLDFCSQINPVRPTNPDRLTQPIPFILSQFTHFFDETFQGLMNEIHEPGRQKEIIRIIVERLNMHFCRSSSLEKNNSVYRIFKQSNENELPVWTSFTDKNIKELFRNCRFKFEASDHDPDGPRRQKKKPTIETPATIWLNARNALSIDQFLFDPKEAPGLIVDEKGRKVWNSYFGLSRDFARSVLPEEEGKARDRLASILFHLRQVLCKGEKRLYSWMERWLCHILKYPWVKSRVAPVFVGPQGSGKSIFWENFCPIFGYHGKVLSDPNLLTHKFYGNEMSTIIFAVLNEVEFGNNPSDLTKGKLKNLVTNDTRKAEAKGGDIKEVNDYLSMVWTANDKNAFPVEHGFNRRYLSIEINCHYAQNLPYFKQLSDSFTLDEGLGLRAFYNYLIRLPVEEGEMDLKEAPFTEEKSQLIATTLNVFHQWWNRILLDGYHCLSGTARGQRRDPLNSGWVMSGCSKQTLYTTFFSALTNEQKKEWANQSKFNDCLFGMLPYCENWEGSVDLFDFPPLKECRMHFQKSVGVFAGEKDENWISNKKIKMTPEKEDREMKKLQLKVTDFFEQ